MKEEDIITYIGNKGIIKNKDGKVLIIKEVGTGCWELPGGKMQNSEIGSDLKVCLEREIREELGEDFKIEIKNVVDNMFRIFDKPRNPVVNKVFLLVWEVNHLGGEIKIQEEELTEYAWVDESSYENYEYVNGYKKVLDNYFKK